jgi:2-polyprenyl-3-methyl-5-hydroxy-6-metoxy-1,4-benzoquinol methylase
VSREAAPLTSREHWSDRWRERGVRSLAVDPSRPPLRDLDRFFRHHLPAEPGLRFLEVGCYPGKFMWYFNRRFGYRVSGLENVGWCCEHARRLLAEGGVEAEVIEGDLLEIEVEPARRWDVVASFGLVEHFVDLRGVIERHLELVRPGGQLVIGVPNHAGIYGRILRWVAPEKHEAHTLISYRDLRAVLEGIDGIEFVAGGYFGRFGFWNCGLYSYLQEKTGRLFPSVRVPFRLVERAAQHLLPNSATLSPNFAAIVEKRASAEPG